MLDFPFFNHFRNCFWKTKTGNCAWFYDLHILSPSCELLKFLPQLIQHLAMLTWSSYCEPLTQDRERVVEFLLWNFYCSR